MPKKPPAKGKTSYLRQKKTDHKRKPKIDGRLALEQARALYSPVTKKEPS